MRQRNYKMNNPSSALIVEDHHFNLDVITDIAIRERLNPGKGLIWALLVSFFLWLFLGISLFILL